MITNKKQEETPALPKNALHRRSFLKYAGLSAGAVALVVAGCKKEDKNDNPAPSNTGINLGSGDTGVLNYAYALEQLEAAFYTQVVANSAFTTIFTASEQTLLTDIKNHEVVHREFLKAALGANAIQALTPNFSTINFAQKASILATAKAFEDLGVSAYNGAGQLLSSATNLLLAGKIVSVEARHASAIRDMLSTTPLNSPDFAGDDVVNPASTSGLDVVRTPAQVLAIAGAYITETLNASNLPTS